ncbi:MAG: OB-fold domain-containing protein [Thermomicrobiales bacterium]
MRRIALQHRRPSCRGVIHHARFLKKSDNNGRIQQATAADPVTKPYWDSLKEHEMKIQKCNDTGEVLLLPARHQPLRSFNQLFLGTGMGKGEICGFSVVPGERSAWPGFQAPYVVAMVELEEGPKLMTHIVNAIKGRRPLNRREVRGAQGRHQSRNARQTRLRRRDRRMRCRSSGLRGTCLTPLLLLPDCNGRKG